LEGGRVVEAQAPLSSIPVFVRDGASAALGATLHWFDEIDGEAYAGRESVAKLAALPEAAFFRPTTATPFPK
ncbi:MAG: hypothetical protein IJP66_09650, partial [Kiritimatiellae bacterium]|nr:hypothetical protein [Kiritimatiellia bacterium]